MRGRNWNDNITRLCDLILFCNKFVVFMNSCFVSGALGIPQKSNCACENCLAECMVAELIWYM